MEVVEMNILVVNCGSSSLKFQLVDSETEQVKASGNCERIGLDGKIVYKSGGKKTETKSSLPDHAVAISKVLELHRPALFLRPGEECFTVHCRTSAYSAITKSL